MNNKKYNRQNSFSKSPSVHQIITYLIVIAELCVFYIAIQSNYRSEKNNGIIFHVLFPISMFFQILGGWICSWMDPVDQLILLKNSGNQNQIKKIHAALQQNNVGIFYCTYCESHVNTQSKHCRICNRCCEDFDHHCIWINNCIGGKNYKYFLFMLICSILTTIVLIASIVSLTLQGQWKNFFVSMIINWIFLVFFSIVFIAEINLLFLHIYLISKGLSTYDFIVLNRVKQQEQKNKKMNETDVELNEGEVNNKIAQGYQKKEIKQGKKILKQEVIFHDNTSNHTQMSHKSESVKKSASQYRNSTRIQRYFSQTQFWIGKDQIIQQRQSQNLSLKNKLHQSNKK